MKVYLVWDRDTYENYGVVYISLDKAKAEAFLKDANTMGKEYDMDGNLLGYNETCWLEERDLDQFKDLADRLCKRGGDAFRRF